MDWCHQERQRNELGPRRSSSDFSDGESWKTLLRLTQCDVATILMMMVTMTTKMMMMMMMNKVKTNCKELYFQKYNVL